VPFTLASYIKGNSPDPLAQQQGPLLMVFSLSKLNMVQAETGSSPHFPPYSSFFLKTSKKKKFKEK
jgi:hypothetical protein